MTKQMMCRQILSLGIAGGILLMTTACGSQLPDASGLTPNLVSQAQSQNSELDRLIQDFSILSYGEQMDLAEDAGNEDMKKFLQAREGMPFEQRKREIHKECQGDPDMMMGIRPPRTQKQAGGECGLEPRPPREGGPSAPRLSREEFAAEYPELATKLVEFKDLEPEARKAAMDALIEEHPEWKEILPHPPRRSQAGGQECGHKGPPPHSHGQKGEQDAGPVGPPPPPENDPV